MKLHLSRADGRNRFSSYGLGYVVVNSIRHERSVIVLPDSVAEWEPARVADLTPAVFAALARLPVEIFVLGTGAQIELLHPALTQPLALAGIGFEVMDTAAACRTYNVLLAEDRRVGAALLIAPSA
jgi:uncharacterized protein